MKHDAEDAIGRVATRQHGAFSRTQAMLAGLSAAQIRVRLSKSAWIKLGRGVYGIAKTVDSWERRAWLRVLEAGEGAALSHEAAAYVWRFTWTRMATRQGYVADAVGRALQAKDG